MTTLHNEHQVEWTRYEIESENTIRVFFLNGDPKCYGARAELQEDADSIKITVFTGLLSNAPEICSMVGVEARLDVTTSQPIGSRTVEDAH